jgi:MFS family permease
MTERQEAGVGLASPPAEPDKPYTMRRVGWASGIGSVIEFYDFTIYGFAAALVFPTVFFPALGTAAGTAATFATLGVAFIARPLGSVLFGHFGDRLGRKKTLIMTLLLMGIATLMIGLMPTAAQIGALAPIAIVALRIMQGLAAGGEWAGAALYASEHAPAAKRGFWAMIPAAAGASTLALAPVSFMITGWSMSEEAFLSYGWRIPFLASFLLIGVGMYIRLRMDETPVFKSELARREPTRVPFLEAFKYQRREILLAGGSMTMVPALSYLAASYLTNYGTTELGLSRNYVLGNGAIAGVALTLAMIAGAVLSDRVGRRAVVITAQAVGCVWALALFPILETGGGSPATFSFGVIVTMIIAGSALGPTASFLSELFHTRYRYTGAGFSYNLGQIIGGALTPFLAAVIVPAFGGVVFSIYLAAVCLLAIGCTIALKETQGCDLEMVGVDMEEEVRVVT